MRSNRIYLSYRGIYLILLALSAWSFSASAINLLFWQNHKKAPEIHWPKSFQLFPHDDRLLTEVQSPKDYQVFQRDERNQAEVAFRFNSVGRGSFLKITVRTRDGRMILDTLNPISIGAGFKTVMALLPAGGWYAVDMQEIDADKIQVYSQLTVAHFGVGEVFVTAGQSNSVAAGQNAQPNVDLVSVGYLDTLELKWGPKIDSSWTGSPWPIFANALVEKLKVPVAIIELGCGGTAISQWLPAVVSLAKAAPKGNEEPVGVLFQHLLTTSWVIGKYRALLWHQGESDTGIGTSSDSYYAQLAIIIGTLATNLPAPPNWIVAKASYVPGPEVDMNTCEFKQPMRFADHMAKIRKAQQAIWDNGLALMGPDTDTLVRRDRYPNFPDNCGLPNCKQGYCIHFSDSGLKKHGQMWFQSVVESGLIPELRDGV